MPQDLPHQTACSLELSSPSPPARANFPLEEEEKVVANHGTPCTSGSTSSCHIEDRGTTWLQEICRTRTSQILYQETVSHPLLSLYASRYSHVLFTNSELCAWVAFFQILSYAFYELWTLCMSSFCKQLCWSLWSSFSWGSEGVWGARDLGGVVVAVGLLLRELEKTRIEFASFTIKG